MRSANKRKGHLSETMPLMSQTMAPDIAHEINDRESNSLKLLNASTEVASTIDNSRQQSSGSCVGSSFLRDVALEEEALSCSNANGGSKEHKSGRNSKKDKKQAGKSSSYNMFTRRKKKNKATADCMEAIKEPLEFGSEVIMSNTAVTGNEARDTVHCEYDSFNKVQEQLTLDSSQSQYKAVKHCVEQGNDVRSITYCSSKNNNAKVYIKAQVQRTSPVSAPMHEATKEEGVFNSPSPLSPREISVEGVGKIEQKKDGGYDLQAKRPSVIDLKTAFKEKLEKENSSSIRYMKQKKLQEKLDQVGGFHSICYRTDIC
eukprot:gene4803-5431_t